MEDGTGTCPCWVGWLWCVGSWDRFPCLWYKWGLWLFIELRFGQGTVFRYMWQLEPKSYRGSTILYRRWLGL